MKKWAIITASAIAAIAGLALIGTGAIPVGVGLLFTGIMAPVVRQIVSEYRKAITPPKIKTRDEHVRDITRPKIKTRDEHVRDIEKVLGGIRTSVADITKEMRKGVAKIDEVSSEDEGVTKTLQSTAIQDQLRSYETLVNNKPLGICKVSVSRTRLKDQLETFFGDLPHLSSVKKRLKEIEESEMTLNTAIAKLTSLKDTGRKQILNQIQKLTGREFTRAVEGDSTIPKEDRPMILALYKLYRLNAFQQEIGDKWQYCQQGLAATYSKVLHKAMKEYYETAMQVNHETAMLGYTDMFQLSAPKDTEHPRETQRMLVTKTGDEPSFVLCEKIFQMSYDCEPTDLYVVVQMNLNFETDEAEIVTWTCNTLEEAKMPGVFRGGINSTS